MIEITVDNVKYIVGRNSNENYEVYKNVPMHSIWFHLNNSPSAHVYAISDQKLSRKELKHSAMLVRQYSKGQGKVCYLSKKNIVCESDGTVIMNIDPKLI
jgi:predicted ribosome quality control (RQC) complex YloA/Tae2 family protein